MKIPFVGGPLDRTERDCDTVCNRPAHYFRHTADDGVHSYIYGGGRYNYQGLVADTKDWAEMLKNVPKSIREKAGKRYVPVFGCVECVGGPKDGALVDYNLNPVPVIQFNIPGEKSGYVVHLYEFHGDTGKYVFRGSNYHKGVINGAV